MKANEAHPWDWPAAILVTLLVYVAAARLSFTSWTAGLRIVELISILGATLGLALGVSKLRKPALRWLLIGYSVTILPWLLSRLIQEETTAFGQMSSLASRLAAAIAAIWHRQPVTDSLFFVTAMTILFWCIGIFSSSQTIRHVRAFGAVIPAMLPLITVQYYDSSHSNRVWTVGLFFLLAILLIGRLNFIENRQRWQTKHIFVGDESAFDMSRSLTVATLSIILLAWMTPTPAAAIPAVARTWREISQSFEKTRSRLDDALASLQNRAGGAPGELYGNTLSLGQSAQQGNQDIFRVEPSELSVNQPYWRMRVYDTYENGRWSVSDSQAVPFYPAEDAPFENENPSDKELTYTFTWQSKASTLLATPGHSLWVSRAGTLQVNALPDEAYNLLSWSASSPIVSGDQYQVRAAFFNPTIKEMREAPATYPDWVVEHYLKLPDDLSNDIYRLAERLTAGYDNNYDKAAAITHYLRVEIEYNEEFTPPPVGIDPIAWFLFTWKSGFCNYYASAEVLLLRSAGIPARMVVGYASGDYQEDKYYQIKTKNAHAWPEVYFSEIGWVEFEPTANMDVLYRPSGEKPTENNTPLHRRDGLARPELGDLPLLDDEALLGLPNANLPSETTNTPSLLHTVWLWIIISVVLLSGAAVVIWRLERQFSFSYKIPHTIKKTLIRYHLDTPPWLDTWVRWNEVSAVERAFHAINQSLAWLDKPQPQNMTALERAALLKQLLPNSTEAIELLTEAHERTLYTPQPASPAAAASAAWDIRRQTLRRLISKSFTRGE